MEGNCASGLSARTRAPTAAAKTTIRTEYYAPGRVTPGNGDASAARCSSISTTIIRAPLRPTRADWPRYCSRPGVNSCSAFSGHESRGPSSSGWSRSPFGTIGNVRRFRDMPIGNSGCRADRPQHRTRQASRVDLNERDGCTLPLAAPNVSLGRKWSAVSQLSLVEVLENCEADVTRSLRRRCPAEAGHCWAARRLRPAG